MDPNLVNQILTIIAIVLFGWDIWQLASSRKNEEIQLKEKQLHKAQVKIWQHFANGITHNLVQITNAIKSKRMETLKTDELGAILEGLQASAHALYTSLNEERLFSEEEIKQRQLEQEQQFKQMLKQPPVSTSASVFPLTHKPVGE